MSKATGTTPNMKTAALIRAYAARIAILMEEGDVVTAYDLLLAAIMRTKASEAEACCHMGRALICLYQGAADPPYRLDGWMCNPHLLEIAERLGMEG